jgi:putative transposase
MQPKYHKGSHSVYSIYLHLVFVTKYRRKIITDHMVQTMAEVFQRVCTANKSKMLEINGEPDHVHLMIDLHPDNNISQLVASLKGASSRIVRKEFAEQIQAVYFGKPVFWSSSYYASSAGGVPLERVKQYIQDQNGFS